MIKLLPVLLLALVVGISGCTTLDSGSENGDAMGHDDDAMEKPDGDAMDKEDGHDDDHGPPQEHIIEMSANGYSPSSLTIHHGDTVTWTNIDGTPNWPASAQHPTHTVYPGSSITKCPSDEIFDACRALDQGESYSFTFDEVGEWFYHNHVDASQFGSITVEG